MPKTGTVLLIILGILVVVAIVLFYRKTVEGFTQQEDAFSEKQKSNFIKGLNRTLFTNADLTDDLKSASAAFATTDTFGNTRNSFLDLSAFFTPDPIPGLEVLNQQCAAVLEPSLMPARDVTTIQGCGWWYVDDPNAISIGAIGTAKQPFNTYLINKQHPGGEWIWDLREAQKKEDIKRCRKITACEATDLFPGKCGFCKSLNKAVPIDSNNHCKYQDDYHLNCGSEVITKVSKCNEETPPPSDCGSLGHASADNAIRLYTKDECDNLDGIFAGDGECLRKGGGSFSWECRGLNSTAGKGGICEPNPATGQLPNNCLLMLAQTNGISEEGQIIIQLQRPNAELQAEIDNKTSEAVSALKIVAAAMPGKTEEMLLPYIGGNGSIITRTDAQNFYSAIIRLASTASDVSVKSAAVFLVYGQKAGVPKYSSCNKNPDDSGPYVLSCLQIAAREAGCQPAGTAFPKNQNKSTYDKMSWSMVKKFFTDLKTSTLSSDTKEQTESVEKCLGIKIIPPVNDCGEKDGIAMYVYQWNYEHGVSNGDVPKSTYYGRMIKPTFPEINNNGDFTDFKIGTDRIHIRTKAVIRSTKSMTTRLWVMSDDGVSINVQGRNVLRKWHDQGPTTYETSPLYFNDAEKKEVNLDWYNNGGGYTYIMRMLLDGKYQPIPTTLLEQTQPTGYPVARWDFYNGTIDDSCGILSSQVVGSVPIGVLDGRKCALFNGRGNHIKIDNAMSVTGFRSITMMLYMNTAQPGYPRPWEFNNNSGFSGQWCDDSLFGCLSPNNSNGVGLYCMKNCTGPQNWTGANTVQTGKWYHIAWVLDENLKGMSIYIDGVIKNRYQNESFNTLSNKIYKNLYIFTSVEQFEKNVGVSWFRIFDYSMTQDDINTDRQNAWAQATPRSANSQQQAAAAPAQNNPAPHPRRKGRGGRQPA
jgi:hypothetical protein